MCIAVCAVAAIYLLYALFVHAAYIYLYIDKSIRTIIERPLQLYQKKSPVCFVAKSTQKANAPIPYAIAPLIIPRAVYMCTIPIQQICLLFNISIYLLSIRSVFITYIRIYVKFRSIKFTTHTYNRTVGRRSLRVYAYE